MLDIKNLGKGIEIGGLGKKAALGAAGGGVLGAFKLKTAIDEGYMDSQLLAYQNSPELKQLHSIAKTHGSLNY